MTTEKQSGSLGDANSEMNRSKDSSSEWHNAALNIAKSLRTYEQYLPLPTFLVLLIYSDPNAFSVLIGLIVISCGLFARVFVRAHEKEHSMLVSELPSDDPFSIYETGPYQLVREPRYTGNILLVAGASIFSGSVFCFFVLTTLAVAYYFLALTVDEEQLIEIYGDKYLDYRKKTPSLLPLRTPSANEIFGQKHYLFAFEREKSTIIMSFVLLLILILFG